MRKNEGLELIDNSDRRRAILANDLSHRATKRFGQLGAISEPHHQIGTAIADAQICCELAAKGGPLPADALQKIALLHSALSAVRDEIESHEVKIGGGAEQPLK